MGDGPNIPWRLLEIDILVEDKETGGNLRYYNNVRWEIFMFLVSSRWKGTGAFSSSAVHSSSDSNAASWQPSPVNGSV